MVKENEHEKVAKTLAQRIIKHESTPKEVVQTIQRAMKENNPYDMANMVGKELRKIWKAIREMNAEAPNNQIKRDEIAENTANYNSNIHP